MKIYPETGTRGCHTKFAHIFLSVVLLVTLQEACCGTEITTARVLPYNYFLFKANRITGVIEFYPLVDKEYSYI